MDKDSHKILQLAENEVQAKHGPHMEVAEATHSLAQWGRKAQLFKNTNVYRWFLKEK